MPENRDLAYKDRFVRYLIQTLSDRFDTIPEFPALPFTDRTSRIPLVYRVNQDEYTQILSAIQTGGDLAFPDIAHELELIWSLPDGYEPEEDTCLDYQTSDSTIIEFAPQDPHTEPELTPPGYLMPPFWIVGDVLPEFLPDWFAEIITDIIEQFTGYEDDDVLTTIGSIPLLANWFELLENGLPRFTIQVETSGKLQLHLLSVPLGGRLLVAVDVEPDIGDIISGIIDESFKIIELERDYSSAPPELDVDHIEEIILEDNEPHIIYCTFIPVVDLDAIPLKFGGGIRKITWCPDAIVDEPCEECPEPTIEELLEDEEFFQTEYLPKTLGTKYSNTETRNETLEAAYDTTPQSIGAEIPTGTPNDEEKNALCAALVRFVKLYCSEKICIIQSRNFLEIAYDTLEDAAESFYDSTLDQVLGNWSDNLFGCIVDVPTALTALADTAAQEDLACYLLDQLDGGAISESAFNTAIDNAATSLSGNEQAIACVMSEDYALSLALNFFQAYNTALLQSAAGDEVDCPCTTGSYRVWKWNFANGLGEFIFDWTGSTQLGDLYSGGIQGPILDGTGTVQVRRPLDPAWRIKGIRVKYSRTHGGSCIMRLRPTPNSNTGAINPSIANGLVLADNQWACQNNNASPFYWTGMNEFMISMTNSTNSAGAYMRVHEIEILYVDGFHESGYKTSDDDLCT